MPPNFKKKYTPHFCRPNIKQFTILFLGPKIWNSRPLSVSYHIISYHIIAQAIYDTLFFIYIRIYCIRISRLKFAFFFGKIF